MRTLEQATAICPSDRRLLVELKRIVRARLDQAEVLLYGSVARGTQDAESDYDILILTDRPVPRARQNAIRGEVFDWELNEGVVFSLLFRDRKGWESAVNGLSPFHEAVEKEAVKL